MRLTPTNRPTMDRWLVWLAQGAGLGRLKPAPGTWGSLGGLVWTWLLLAPGNAWCFYGGLLVGTAASVSICGEAERILGERDPGSVVLDEIVAIPLCFAAWVGMHQFRSGGMPSVDFLLHGRGLCLVAAVFVSFRFFDILKPWPVRQSQELPGGWGVTVDDLLAALYVCVITLAGTRFWG